MVSKKLPEGPYMSDSIDYGNLMHAAMRSLIQKVLLDVAIGGLPGEHHFFITFDTMHPDVEIADWLSDRFPEDMTIVVQHWFDNLEVTDEGFSITLNFGDQPETMFIPYDAIRTFVDPSVEFGLRFETQEEEGDDEENSAAPDPDAEKTKAAETDLPEAQAQPEADEAPMQEAPEDTTAHAAEVVSLDSFRK